MIRFLASTGIFLLLTVVAPVWASDYEARQKDMEALRTEIRQLEKELARSQERRDDVSLELQAMEQAIGTAARKLRELTEQQHANAVAIATLTVERDEREAAIGDQRDYLVREIRSAYMLGNQHYLKLLLNHQNPATLERMLVYFESIGAVRQQRIQQAMADLQALQITRESLDREQARLAELEQAQARQARELQARRDERGKLLATLESEMKAGRGQLERLAADEAVLEDLMNKLRQTLADIPESLADTHQGNVDQGSFASQRGQLAWPVNGQIAVRYGASRGQGDHEKWRGILLAANQGAPVRAVSQGRVVFANWLRGLGLLLIIDHGQGHMTLYGHNDSLYKDVGEWVRAGDVIGGVGDTGGPDRAGLYFELRVGGQPQDPLSWLRSERGGGS